MSVRQTNRFWFVSLEHTLFLDFLKKIVNMRLAISFAGKKMHFFDLRIKSYGCLKFQEEIWAGWACVAANEKELTTLLKFWGQGGWTGGQGVKIVGHPRRAVAPTQRLLIGQQSPGQQSPGQQLLVGRRIGDQRSPGGRPRPAAGGDQWSPTGRGQPPTQAGAEVFFIFFGFFIFLFFYFFRPLHVTRAWTSWGGGMCTIPHFLKYAPTLGSANSSKIHREWRFYFFQKKNSKFRAYLDLHIYRWDFCFMKNLIP
jgi:hypothetical protein